MMVYTGCFSFLLEEDMDFFLLLLLFNADISNLIIHVSVLVLILFDSTDISI